MKRLFALTLAIALVLIGLPAPLMAARQNTATLAGIAKDNGGNPLGNYTVQLRNVATGQLAGTTTSAATGTFSFTGLAAGNYAIEIVDAVGHIVATSATISVAAGAAVTGVAVTATAASAAAMGAAAGGVGAFFASTGGIVLLAAAGAGITAGVVSATGSPSK